MIRYYAAHTSTTRRIYYAHNGPRFRTTEEMNGGSSSYVPAGLTPEQYQKIKQEEQKELRKKNFGAWGPRFNRSVRPEGDWMVLPSLWTNGFQTAQSGKHGTTNNNKPLSTLLITRMILLLSEYIPSLAVSTILWTTLFSAATITRRSRAATLSKMAHYILSQTLLCVRNMKTTTRLSLLAIVVFSAIPIQKFVIEKLNRKWLWSPRRSVVTSFFACLLSLGIWFGLCSINIGL